MPHIVTGGAVWPAIAELLQTPGRRQVAVAYLGEDAGDLLDALSLGDLLICNAGLAALRGGSTSPVALRRFLDRGVTLRSHARLHAKIYIGGRAAFVGSANASATAVRQAEAGYITTAAAQVRELEAFISELASSAEATVIDDAYVEWAGSVARPARPAQRGNGARGREVLHVASYGDPAPASVTAAAEKQRRQQDTAEDDSAATVGWSWGSEGTWRPGDWCVWLERGDGDADGWLAEPPAECCDAQRVPGRSKQWIYWWRTPAGPETTWGELRRQVLLRTGERLALDSSTRAVRAIDAVFALYGVDRTSAGLLDEV